MLIKDFYTINDLIFRGSGFDAAIQLNPNHEVYQGHFPEQPVVPGVIQLQIVKELLEEVMQTKLMMDNVIQVKYLIPITPNENPELIFSIMNKTVDENTIKSTITIGFNDLVFTKARISFLNIS
jgi:3-hydroxyacyl-[acyl-carrier-protein] dehydratase